MLLEEIEIGADALEAEPAVRSGRPRCLDSCAASACLCAADGSEADLLFPIIHVPFGAVWSRAMIAGGVGAGHEAGEDAVEGVHSIDVQYGGESA